MKIIRLSAVLLYCLVLVGCGNDEDPGLELLDNIELEEGFGKPIGWNNFISATELTSEFDFEWTTLEALSGEKSMRIFIDSEIENEFASWTRTVIFDSSGDGGNKVELSVWMKGNMIGEGVSLILRGDRSGEIIFSENSKLNNSISGNFDWMNVKISTTLEEEIDSFSIFLILLGGTKGEVYFDDVSLTRN